MSEIKPLLTIGIPVFNGEAYLRETLNSVVNQVDQYLSNKIEVIISDNASEDYTKKISIDYCSNYKYVKYFENNENVGFDRNLDLIFKRASGDFVWLLGDDDVIKYGAIRRALDLIIKSPELSVIFVNYN
ncbi:MAG: glycosyltransferase family 2 protein, partial [Candidatus Humimicrobiaceae bacterium]